MLVRRKLNRCIAICVTNSICDLSPAFGSNISRASVPRHCQVLFLWVALTFPIATTAVADNSVFISDQTGTAQNSRPLTISRVFAQGEIANYPRPSVAGTTLSQWQANVMSRWSDGSVKHALVTFTQTIGANASARVLFVNDANPCHLGNQAACDAAAPTQAQILAFDSGNWDEEIQTTQAGGTTSTDARTMTSAGFWRFWIQGPLANIIIVEDRTTAHTYDYGYKDSRYTRPGNGDSIASTDSTITVLDAGDIAAGTLPAVIQVDSEKMIVSSANPSTNVLTISTRGYNVTGHSISAAASVTNPIDGNLSAKLTATDARIATGDTVVVSGATGCWAAINGTYNNNITVQYIDVNDFLVEANISSCSGSVTGTVTYSTTSSSAAAHSWYDTIFSLDQAQTWVNARNSNYVSLHPIFVLTQYAGWPGVKAEFILEQPWIDRLQDQTYSVTLNNGSSLANNVYTKASYVMASGSRWRKTYWDGTTPGSINIDFNFPYMIATKVVPNYDTSLVVPSGAITTEYANWTSSDLCDLGGHGEWQPNFQAVGGRPDLGLFPLWTTMWLYTMNPNIYTDMMGNAECAPQIGQVHWREDQSASGSSYWYDAAQTVNGFGHEISIYDRPGLSSLSFGLGSYPSAAAFPYPVAFATGGIWGPDVAHQASFVFIPYLVTGDSYWYEELLFWSSFDYLHDNSGATDGYGFLTQPGSEPRGLGWGLRNIAHAAFASPDNQPSQAVNKAVLDNNIAYREGMFDITTGSFYNPASTSPWYFGFNVIQGGQADALRILRQIGHYDTPVDNVNFYPSLTCGTGAPWQDHLNIMVNGHIEELGYSKIAPLRKAEVALIIHEAADPAYNPYLSGSYHAPAAQQDGVCNSSTSWVQKWADMYAAWTPAGISGAAAYFTSTAGDADFGYANIARAAGSYGTDVTDGEISGQAAWTWLYANANNRVALASNPKWALLPRNFVPSAGFGPCDLNGDGLLNSADVTIVLNQALGIQACSTGDLNRDGQCNVLDVEIEIESVLQQVCLAP